MNTNSNFSDNSGKSMELDADYKENCDINFSLPKIGFKKDLETNNYLNSSIQCLTNIKILSQFMLFNSDYVKEPNEIDNNNVNRFKYCEIINSLIVNLNENNEKINEFLKKLKEYISNERQYNCESKDNQNPKELIKFLLKEFNDINLLPEEIKIIFTKNCSCKENLEIDDLCIIEFDIMETTRYFNTNRKLTIYDCFDNYFKSLNNKKKFKCEVCKKNVNVSVKKLPSILIIFINYGFDKNSYYENAYEFDENIHFKNFNKEYFLSGMIACKNIGTYFELFYTFSRLDKNSNYTLYNGSEVRNNLKITNKLKKQKIDLKDKKQSWPFVLIYVGKN